MLLVQLQNVGNEALRSLSYLSPFRYLDFVKVLETGGVDVPFVVVTAAIAAGLLVLSVAVYRKKEFAV